MLERLLKNRVDVFRGLVTDLQAESDVVDDEHPDPAGIGPDGRLGLQLTGVPEQVTGSMAEGFKRVEVQRLLGEPRVGRQKLVYRIRRLRIGFGCRLRRFRTGAARYQQPGDDRRRHTTHYTVSHIHLRFPFTATPRANRRAGRIAGGRGPHKSLTPCLGK